MIKGPLFLVSPNSECPVFHITPQGYISDIIECKYSGFWERKLPFSVSSLGEPTKNKKKKENKRLCSLEFD